MATRKLTVRDPEGVEQAPEQDVLSQRKRPETGRFILQVDGQTKSSYQTNDAAQAAGLAIKKGYPKVQVVICDRVDNVNKAVEAS
jgi:hypothetical protein